MSRPRWQLRDAAVGYAARGIPVLPLHYLLPHAVASSRSAVINRLRWERAARVGIQAAASLPSTPWAAWSLTASRTPPPTGPGSWPGGPATPRPTSASPVATASTAPSPVRLLVESHGLTLDQLRDAVLEELDQTGNPAP